MKKSSLHISAAVILTALWLAACGRPEQRFAITVTDVSGKPMEGIDCTAGFNRSKTDGTGIAPYVVSGKTNAKGKLGLSGETVFFDTSVKCRGEGYYDSIVEKLFITGKTSDRWEPWPVDLRFVMKKIGNPKPMYALKPGTSMDFNLPKDVAQPVGFDLMERDWVEPHGKGQNPDFLLQFQRDDPDATGSFPKGKMKLTFPNPADGIYPAFSTAQGESVLLSPAQASEGGYESSAEFSSDPHSDGIYPGLATDRRTWVFRVRSTVDEQGNLISARYGKIQGAPEVVFFSHGTAFRMTYYLNKDPNDRGLEWDMQNNLFADLPQHHWPRNP